MADVELISSGRRPTQDPALAKVLSTLHLKRYVFSETRKKLKELHELERQHSHSESEVQVKSRPLTLLMTAAGAIHRSICEGKQAQNFKDIQKLQASHVPDQSETGEESEEPEEPENEKGKKWEGDLFEEAVDISHRLSLLRQMDPEPYVQCLQHLEDLKNKMNALKDAAMADLGTYEDVESMYNTSLGLADKAKEQVKLATENLAGIAFDIIADTAEASVNEMAKRHSLHDVLEDMAPEISEEELPVSCEDELTDSYIPMAGRQPKVKKSNVRARGLTQIHAKLDTGNHKRIRGPANHHASHQRVDPSKTHKLDGRKGLVYMPRSAQHPDANLPATSRRSDKMGNRMPDQIRNMLDLSSKGSPRNQRFPPPRDYKEPPGQLPETMLQESSQPEETNLSRASIRRESAELVSKLEHLLTNSVVEVAEIMEAVGDKSGEVLKNSTPFGKQVNGLLESVSSDHDHIDELLSAAEVGEKDFGTVWKRAIKKLNAVAGMKSAILAARPRQKVMERLTANGWQRVNVRAEESTRSDGAFHIGHERVAAPYPDKGDGVRLAVPPLAPAHMMNQPQALTSARSQARVIKVSPFVGRDDAYDPVEPVKLNAKFDVGTKAKQNTGIVPAFTQTPRDTGIVFPAIQTPRGSRRVVRAVHPTQVR